MSEDKMTIFRTRITVDNEYMASAVKSMYLSNEDYILSDQVRSDPVP